MPRFSYIEKLLAELLQIAAISALAAQSSADGESSEGATPIGGLPTPPRRERLGRARRPRHHCVRTDWQDLSRLTVAHPWVDGISVWGLTEEESHS